MSETAVQDNRVHLKFTSHSSDVDGLHTLGMSGREALGELFQYEILVERDAGPLSDAQLDALTLESCTLTMGRGEHDVIHGLVKQVDMTAAYEGTAAYYRITIVPQVWLLTKSRICRVFQKQSVVEMAEAILASYGLQKDRDFEIRVARTQGHAPSREFVVQFEESDWDFLQRWFEYEGYFFWFQHGPEQEKLVIADQNTDADTVVGGKIAYRDKNNLWANELPTIFNWRVHQKRVPARVAVVDYNYRQPASPIFATADVDTAHGFGVEVRYGEHFRGKEGGKRIAGLRADRSRSEKRIYSGETDCPHLHVGFLFELDGYFVKAEDQKRYLITELTLSAGHPVDAEDPADIDALGAARGFRARFRAVREEAQYRPPIVTEWPSIHGVLHGHIDSATDGQFADLDDDGRYLVRLPFDNLQKPGQVSQRIRMAQPFSGSNHGMHFPLHRGTEVLLAFLDGNPDRPIIIGAVPNPTTPSTSGARTANQYGIRGPAGTFAITHTYASSSSPSARSSERGPDEVDPGARPWSYAPGTQSWPVAASSTGSSPPSNSSSPAAGAGGTMLSQIPAAPALPAIPAIPSPPAIPEAPPLPALAGLSLAPSMPGAPSLPPTPAIPGIPSVAAGPALSIPAVPPAPAEPSLPAAPAPPSAPVVAPPAILTVQVPPNR